TLTIDLPDTGSVTLNSGVWNQGAANLVINGDPAGFTPPTFTIGDGLDKATFSIGAATLTMTSGGVNDGSIDVQGAGNFEVTAGATLDDGAGTLTFEPASTFEPG